MSVCKKVLENERECVCVRGAWRGRENVCSKVRDRRSVNVRERKGLRKKERKRERTKKALSELNPS